MSTKQARRVSGHLAEAEPRQRPRVGSTPTLLFESLTSDRCQVRHREVRGVLTVKLSLLVALVCCSGCRAAAPAGAERPTSTLANEIHDLTGQLQKIAFQLCTAANRAATEHGFPVESCAHLHPHMEGRP